MDITLFKAINNLAGNNPLADRMFIFISSYGPFLLAGLLALLWFWPREHSIRHRQQQIVLIALLSVVVSLLANQVIIRVWDRPRPFTVQATNLLLPPSQEPSFPSDHATFAFAIAVAILLASRRLGIFGGYGMFAVRNDRSEFDATAGRASLIFPSQSSGQRCGLPALRLKRVGQTG